MLRFEFIHLQFKTIIELHLYGENNFYNVFEFLVFLNDNHYL